MTEQPDNTPQPDHGGTPEGVVPMTHHVECVAILEPIAKGA